MLKIENLSVNYGEVNVIQCLDFEVEKGKIVTLLGANGAGKTTILKVITGFVKPKNGKVIFNGKDLSRLDPKDIVREGIAMVPEGRKVFSNLTVKENLMMGAWLQKSNSIKSSCLEEIFTLFPILRERLKQKAGTLSGGEQQMLAIGRALMSRPKLLLMDEPSLGLAPLLVAQVFSTIKEIHNHENLTILLVEQNVRAALKIADYGFVLETGNLVIKGTTDELKCNVSVQKAFIGS